MIKQNELALQSMVLWRFRKKGQDTFDIGRELGIPEARVCELLSAARNRQPSRELANEKAPNLLGLGAFKTV